MNDTRTGRDCDDEFFCSRVKRGIGFTELFNMLCLDSLTQLCKHVELYIQSEIQNRMKTESRTHFKIQTTIP